MNIVLYSVVLPEFRYFYRINKTFRVSPLKNDNIEEFYLNNDKIIPNHDFLKPVHDFENKDGTWRPLNSSAPCFACMEVKTCQQYGSSLSR